MSCSKGNMRFAVESCWRNSPLTRVENIQVRQAADLIHGYHCRAHGSGSFEVLALGDIELSVSDVISDGAFIHEGKSGDVLVRPVFGNTAPGPCQRS